MFAITPTSRGVLGYQSTEGKHIIFLYFSIIQYNRSDILPVECDNEYNLIKIISHVIGSKVVFRIRKDWTSKCNGY
ncbi:hypothetical protein Hanom_Chr14g01259171 [Helianthus anomalus]